MSSRVDIDGETSGILHVGGKGYCPHLSKRRDKNKLEMSSRRIAGWGHRVKGQIDTECCLVFQHDTVVHVLSERAAKPTSTVSMSSKETGQFRHG